LPATEEAPAVAGEETWQRRTGDYVI